MLTINNKLYSNYRLNITWETFTVSSYKMKRTGIAPFIEFIINDNIYIGLEMTYSDNMFKECELNKKNDITKYISDVVYEDEKGWISINNFPFQCFITKKDDNNFFLEFTIDFSLSLDDYNITINDTLKIF